MAGTQRQYRQLTVAVLLALSSVATNLAAAPVTGTAVAPLPWSTWSDLSDSQKQVLSPLEKVWGQLDQQQQIKWVVVAERFPNMQPGEQERIRKQMLNWALLTPEQRKLVREKYKNLKQAPPDKREAIRQKWNEYQELSGEEKQELSQKAKERKITRIPGAVIKPLSRQTTAQSLPAIRNVDLGPFVEDWPNVIPGPVPAAGTALYPLPAGPKRAFFPGK